MTTRTFDQPNTYGVAGYLPFDFGNCGSQQWTPAYGDANPLATVRRGAYRGQSTRDYHKLVKAGGVLPLNAYKRWDYRYVANPGDYAISGEEMCYGQSVPFEATYKGLTMPPRYWDVGDDALQGIPNPWEGVNTDALLIAAMADMLPDLDALTTALEARQTMDMVVHARRDAKRLIREALRGGFHTVKAASDAWLAWRYGWQQLGYDIKNVYNLLLTPIQALVVEGRSGESRVDSYTAEEAYYWASSDGVYAYDVNIDISVRANAIGILRGETLNLIANPAISFWEKVPYSFVADWFVNVGDVLAAWKVRASMARLYLSLGSKMDITCKGDMLVQGNGSDPTTSATANASSMEWFASRERIPASTPSLVPSFDVKLTSPRILDAAALLSKRIL